MLSLCLKFNPNSNTILNDALKRVFLYIAGSKFRNGNKFSR